MRAELREKLRALLEREAPGLHTCTIAIDGAMVDVAITVRRTAGDGLPELREAVAAHLKAHPWAVENCGCGKTKAGRFGSGTCHNRPTVAVEYPRDGFALSDQRWAFTYVCAAHAKRFLDRRTLRVRDDLLADARREAKRLAQAARLVDLANERAELQREHATHLGPVGRGRWNCPDCEAARTPPSIHQVDA